MPSGCSRVQNTPNVNVIFLRRDDDAEYRREGKDSQRVPGQALVPVPKDEVTTMQSCASFVWLLELSRDSWCKHYVHVDWAWLVKSQISTPYHHK